LGHLQGLSHGLDIGALQLMVDKSDKRQFEQQRREAVLRQIEEDMQDRQQAQALKAK